MQKMELAKNITPHRDINDVLYFLLQNIKEIFKEKLTGFYLTGSLSYGDFEKGRSDIDLVVVLKRAVSSKQMKLIEILHAEMGQKFPKWAERVECSYVPMDMLSNILPPKEPRPYFGGGIFYPEAPCGNEWLINNYLLYKYSIPLLGPDFKTLIEPISIEDVKQACRRDLDVEWKPKITDNLYLENSHQQSYVVLNLCRILYTVMNGETVSKKVANNWAKKEYPEWRNLIETADNWHYGAEMKREQEVVEFIKFAIKKVE